MPAKAILISIGDEILYGQTLDTNAHWISGELDSLGIRVTKRITIGDTREEILSNLEEAENDADIILITGGLGPTSDDLTKPCLVEYFDTHLVRNEEMLNNVKRLFAKIGREISEVNERQSDLPANCTPILNMMGTAPGMWFERNGKVIVSMPGVPYEMKRIMKDTVLPKLASLFIQDAIYHRMIRTIGIGESMLAETIKDWEKALPPHIKLAYLPTMGSVKLRLTTSGESEATKKEVQEQIDKVLPLIEKYVYGFDDEEIEEAIGRLLSDRNYKLAIAESCTGGFLSHKITSVPGSSQWFNGAFVPYSNELKNEKLKVDGEIIRNHGAVSEPVVLALAKNVREEFKADVGVSISGIAGPGGGTEEKPVGTVWIGYSDKKKTVAKKFQFVRDRSINIAYSAVAALNMIRINLDKD
ncbi:nicotinamide-nucleotide amidase [Ekhidna lutea]|uniref:CinA-like protein n=1 Tax=Ekhidna lutea TaxID=447679 RepID=A0A239I1L5_EKHLU|nr:competence/damage-inducible protein A [Ekhidna lutea]SNS86254.1 nicotinamide-nucleotide amidase [Ekhidna lutea]